MTSDSTNGYADYEAYETLAQLYVRAEAARDIARRACDHSRDIRARGLATQERTLVRARFADTKLVRPNTRRRF